jgi:hypothetical protein
MGSGRVLTGIHCDRLREQRVRRCVQNAIQTVFFAFRRVPDGLAAGFFAFLRVPDGLAAGFFA